MRVCVHLQTQEMVHFSVTRQLAMCCCVWCVCAMYVLCLCPHPPNSLFFRSVLSLSVFLFSLFLLFVVFVVMLLLLLDRMSQAPHPLYLRHHRSIHKRR